MTRVIRFAMLACGPVALLLHFWAPERHLVIFATAVLALLPLAGYIGHATEILAERYGGGIGGLLNATFGNAAELIIGALALREGLIDLVKASITGSILGNVLLVFGAAALVGGYRRPVQRFNRTAAGVGTTMLLLSVVGLIVPALLHRVAPAESGLRLDTEIAVVLFITYLLGLVFTLRTHKDAFGVVEASGLEEGSADAVPSGASTRNAVLLLLASTIAVAVVSEVLVGSVSATAEQLGLTQIFVGVIVVALVGNAAEHFSAVTMAAQDKMDTAIAIAVGSSTQIALFVAPVLVFLSYLIAPTPMDLLFTPFEIASLGVAVLSISFIAHDGETHWMEGVQLLAVYVILALGFFYLPH
ncbi:calcium/proton exchanger [Luteitalea sp. TBR-22]|uniref:calcium/proton exchanger n=1 Tax=Luteitalea sp. TBR-22 TaxID=2802971 RepID=UPI001AF4ADF9|nr:calcium/proton exchanger [Luteitalea sp. TBR-22]BCS32431.1 calcium/proton exchanger [Luteitalea sp. TBR-22]